MTVQKSLSGHTRTPAQTTSSAESTETAPRAQPQSFVKDVRLDYGPPELISAFLIAADTTLADHGLTLSFSSFQELLRVNGENRNTWLPLNPTFNPANGLVDSDNAFCLLGRNGSGQVVTAQAMRIFDWHDTDLKREAESLRLLYLNPPASDGCRVTAPSAPHIRGRVGYGGAIWLHPSVRGRRVPAWMSRIHRAYAYTRWQIDMSFGITSTALLKTGFIEASGFPHSEKGVAFDDPTKGPPDGAIFWITADEMLADWASFLEQSDKPSGNSLKVGNG